MVSKVAVIAAPLDRAETRAGVMWLCLSAVAAITLVGLFVRVKDLPLATVSLSIDEARLALVAQGIQEHGWPVLPSGKVYTRGLPVALSMVPSLDILGRSDFAARLPSALFGALVVPVVALHAGRMGGLAAAVIVAVLVALYPPLISWSRQAWLFSLFVLLWMLTLLGLDMALTRRSSPALMLAAIATALGLLTHELFLTLLPCWLLALMVTSRQAEGRREALGSLLPPFVIVVLGLAALSSFTLTHRADTLAGRMSEVHEYLTFNTDLASFRFYGRMLTDRYWLLLIAAIAALVLRREPRRLMLLVAIIPLFVVDSFVLPDRPQDRYGLALVPPMMLLAAVGLNDVAAIARHRFPGSLGLIVTLALLMGVPLLHLDFAGVARRMDVSHLDSTWLPDLERIGYLPGDVVMTDIPTVTQEYLGKTDYWLVSREYEKYAYMPDGQLREIHTNARLIRSVSELDRVLRDELRGQRVWVIGSDRSYQWQELVDRSVRRAIDDQAVAKLQSEDTVRLFRLEP
jgi:hypothetical protein